jgi:hypothetical protein
VEKDILWDRLDLTVNKKVPWLWWDVPLVVTMIAVCDVLREKNMMRRRLKSVQSGGEMGMKRRRRRKNTKKMFRLKRSSRDLECPARLL